MTATYRFAPSQSTFTVQAFASGLLAVLGHSPTFAVGEFSGSVRFDPADPRSLAVALTVRAESLDLLDRVKPADRDDILGRARFDVLETDRFPEVAFRTSQAAAEPAGDGRFQAVLGGTLSLHGVERPLRIDAQMTVAPESLRLRGHLPLRMSPFGIKPVTALRGTIRLKDEVRLVFDLLALPEPH
jgi:polyisoprenoid-binding protein YceI